MDGMTLSNAVLEKSADNLVNNESTVISQNDEIISARSIGSKTQLEFSLEP